MRKSAAEAERQGYARAADEMQNMLITAGTDIGTARGSDSAITDLISQLRQAKPLGRISIIADPAMLAANPDHDPLLEPGDVLFIPQRPGTVTILGQVLQPGTLPFDARSTVSDYIERVGGYNQFADESLTFVVMPDGTARRVEFVLAEHEFDQHPSRKHDRSATRSVANFHPPDRARRYVSSQLDRGVGRNAGRAYAGKLGREPNKFVVG